MSTYYDQTVFSPWLTPVRVVSTSNISGSYFNGPNNNGVGAQLTISASSLTVDGVLLVQGDRVLLQTQTATYQQGIYEVLSIGSTVVLQRAADQQSQEQIKTGQYVSVKGGTANAGGIYTVIEPQVQGVGIGTIVFSADPSLGGAVTFSGAASTPNALAVYSNTAGNLKAQSTASTLGFGLTLTTGNLNASAGNISSGLGAGGFVGLIEAFPTTASSGFIALQGAVNASGNFGTTLSNQTTQAQSQVLTLPDVGATTGNILAAGAALVSGNLVQASGTKGAVSDSGISLAAGAAAGVVQSAIVTLTAAQINASYATPTVLVAAPGASQTIIVLNAQVVTEVSTAFTAGGVAQIQYGVTIHGAGTIATSATIAAAEITAATSQIFTQAPIAAATVMATASFKGLGLYFSNATQAFATGTGSTVTFCIQYVIIPTV